MGHMLTYLLIMSPFIVVCAFLIVHGIATEREIGRIGRTHPAARASRTLASPPTP